MIPQVADWELGEMVAVVVVVTGCRPHRPAHCRTKEFETEEGRWGGCPECNLASRPRTSPGLSQTSS